MGGLGRGQLRAPRRERRRGKGGRGAGRQAAASGARLRLRANAAQLLQLGLQPLGRRRRLARLGRLAPRAQLLLVRTRLYLRQPLEGPGAPRHHCLSRNLACNPALATPPPASPPSRASPPRLGSGSDPGATCTRATCTQPPRTGRGRRRQWPRLHQSCRLVRSRAASLSASPAVTLAHRRSACESPTASRAPRTWEVVEEVVEVVARWCGVGEVAGWWRGGCSWAGQGKEGLRVASVATVEAVEAVAGRTTFATDTRRRPSSCNAECLEAAAEVERLSVSARRSAQMLRCHRHSAAVSPACRGGERGGCRRRVDGACAVGPAY